MPKSSNPRANELQMKLFLEVMESTLPGYSQRMIYDERTVKNEAWAWLNGSAVKPHLIALAVIGRNVKRSIDQRRDIVLINMLSDMHRLSDETCRWMAWPSIESVAKLTAIPEDQWDDAMTQLSSLDENLT